jgi:hypothetical protein
MVRKSLHGSTIVRRTITIAARTNGTVNGTGVDMTDPTGGVDSFTSAMFIVYTGTITDGTHTFTCQESDDNSTFTAVAAAELQGTSPVVTATDDDQVYAIGYMGSKRYLRLSVVSSGTTTGGIFGGLVLLGDPGSKPVQR